MRKANREIKEFDNIVALLDKCDTVRIGFFDEDYPYILPMSFGFEVEDSKIVIYTHGAREGKKHDLAVANPRVCVEADIFNGYVPVGESFTTDYQSLIGYGTVEIAEHDDAIRGVNLLMKRCGKDNYDATKCIEMAKTEVFKITVDSVTGKKRF